MPSKELIEKVASHFEFPDKETTLITAENILSEILAALQKPTDEMMRKGIMYTDFPSQCWRAMLNASALGEQSE